MLHNIYESIDSKGVRVPRSYPSKWANFPTDDDYYYRKNGNQIKISVGHPTSFDDILYLDADKYLPLKISRLKNGIYLEFYVNNSVEPEKHNLRLLVFILKRIKAILDIEVKRNTQYIAFLGAEDHESKVKAYSRFIEKLAEEYGFKHTWISPDPLDGSNYAFVAYR